MSNRNLIVLMLLGVLSLGGGWYFGPGMVRPSVTTAEAGSLVFPGLAERLAQTRRVEILHQGKTVVIEPGGDGVWGLADRDFYPVQVSALRDILTGLTELRLVEPRTSDPAKFARLGVENPDTPDATSKLLRVLDASGNPLAAIVLGHRRVRTQGNVPESVYVRLMDQGRRDQEGAWLAEGKLEVSADPLTLIDRDILSIPPERIVNVAVTRGTERLEFARDGDQLVLRIPSDPRAMEAYRLDDIGRALDNLTMLDVRRAQEPASLPMLGEAVFTAIDGLEVQVRLFKDEKNTWARFSVSGPEAIREDVQALAGRLTLWEFQISHWKEKTLVPTLEDLPAAPADPSGAKP